MCIGFKRQIIILLALTVGGAFWGQTSRSPYSVVWAGEVSKDKQEAFDEVIQPWIKDWFIKHATEVNIAEDTRVERRLVNSNLYRFENVNGQETYSVNILYYVTIRDRPSKLRIWGLKEQQIVFWLNGKVVMDYFPLNEYWKEEPHYRVIDEMIQL